MEDLGRRDTKKWSKKTPSHAREVSRGDRDVSKISEKSLPHPTPRDICRRILNDMKDEGVEQQKTGENSFKCF